MRIAFDARPLLGRRTGVGVWLEGLLEGLASTPGLELVGLLPRPGRVELGAIGERVSIEPSSVALPGTLWLHTVAGPRLGRNADVFLGTLGILPRRLEVPSVLVVHDLTPLTRPAQHTLANRFCFNAYFEHSLEAADVVVCDSEATRVRLEANFSRRGLSAEVIHPGVGDFFTPAEATESGEDIRRRISGGRRFILQLGTLEPRKGATTLVDAHATMLGRGTDVDLVLAGGRGWGGAFLEDALARHPQPSRVRLPGYLPREDVRDLLRHAEVVVVAAEEEGYGLPLAEALVCGAACVASDEPALVEVSAGAALHVPRRDAGALADAISRLVDDEAARAERRRLSRRRAPSLRWHEPLGHWRKLLAALTLSRDATAGHRRS